MKKKFYAGVAAIFKNEAPFIVEWIAHHRLIGIEHFFIANNESEDETTLVLEALEKAGYITHHRFPNPAYGTPQLPAYEMLLEKHRADAEWLAFIDADEFIWPTTSKDSLKEFLCSFESLHPDVGVIALNWATYGSSGHVFSDSRLVVERFSQHAPITHFLNKHFKSLVRTAAATSFTCPHNVSIDASFSHRHTDGSIKTSAIEMQEHPQAKHSLSEKVIWENFRLNHYVIKSFDEFYQKKRPRGRPYPCGDLNNQFYLGHNVSGEITRPNPAYLRRIEAEVEQIYSDIGVATRPSLTPTTREMACAQWAAPAVGTIDGIQFRDGQLHVHGWALLWGTDSPASVTAIDRLGHAYQADHFQTHARPDVAIHYPAGHIICGFEASFPDYLELGNSPVFAATSHDGVRSVPLELGVTARATLLR